MTKIWLSRVSRQPRIERVGQQEFYGKQVEVTDAQLKIMKEIESKHNTMLAWAKGCYEVSVRRNEELPPFPKELEEEYENIKEKEPSKEAGTSKRVRGRSSGDAKTA